MKLRKDMMDTAEGREAFMYELYPLYAKEAGWTPFGDGTPEEQESERKMFARAQAAPHGTVAIFALRQLLSLLPDTENR